ncbi:50S ribosomal protein L4 [Senegalimassilia faecalis]|uniref:Large ribosomal subunit protein uL4 n=1 Tax=Senegalimassilia faecalis TaxID=2509433 RepID=A0A4Q2K2B7_9ACTN|nr:50S ribosomal protein L4 [Senegalimassilia faecalis]RXZ53352.1 50S ribosomal protein L4 [Senegalimassilia faecalis]
MTTIEIKDASGKKAGDAELSASVFGIEPNVPVMHQVVRAQRASWRAGTSNTLTRGNVRGGGKKPWRQKGTGRARQGSIRSPQWRGGGTVFGPHPRSYAFRVNNKEVKLAMRSALSAKLADGQFTVVDGFNFEKPRTKDAKAFIQAMGFEGQRTTLVIGNEDVTTWLSFRNLEKVNVLPVAEANTYELLDNKQLVFTAEALKRIEEVLA